jgi:hypothetical protein
MPRPKPMEPGEGSVMGEPLRPELAVEVAHEHMQGA